MNWEQKMTECVCVQTAELTPVVADTEAMVTVLAPTDEAFNMIPEEELMALLAEPDALGQVCTLFQKVLKY